MTDSLTMTLQDYLEAIYHIEAEKRVARPRDICRALDVHKSTVTAALRNLAERGLINYAPYEAATLTEAGLSRARRIAARHLIIQDFLQVVLDVEREAADTNARRIQHAVDEKILERIVCFLVFTKRNPDRGAEWLEAFQCFSQETLGNRHCEEWIREYLMATQHEEGIGG